jgi:nucleoid-associated protein YgaU
MQTITIMGGTLFELASAYLGDATQWNRIASLNGIGDPWLTGLTTLVIPAENAFAGGGVGPQ